MSAFVADELTIKIDSNVSGALAGLSAVETKAKGTGSRVAAGAAKLVKGGVASVAIAGVVVGSVAAKMAMGFETGMAQIEANVGTTGADLEKLSDAALRMGGEFGVAADEAASGLFFLQSAGLSVDDSIAALETSSKMAAMGLGDMETIANGLTTAMTNWGIESAEAGDIVAKAVELGKAAPEEMTKILNQNAAAAASTGMSFNDLATVSAFLTRTTGDANKAGTQMQGMLAKLIKPSEQGKKMVESLGISFDDFASAVANDPVNALKEFDGAFAEAGVASNEWMGKVFEDVNAINGAMTIVNGSADELSGMQQSMADSAGKVDAGFGVVADTMEFRMGTAIESLKSALIPIGAVILDIVIPAVEVLAGWLKEGIEWLQGLLGGSEDLQSGMGEAFGGIMELVAVVKQWWDEHWGEISEIIEKFKEVFTNILDDIVAFAKPLIADMVAFFQETFGELIAWFQENWPYIQETIMIVLENVQKVWDIVWPYLALVIENTWNTMKVIIETVIGVIQGIIETVMGLIRGDWEQAWNGIKKIFGSIWDGIVGVVEEKWNLVKGFLEEALGTIREIWDKAWEGMKEALGTVFGGLANVVRTPLNGILGALESGINAALRGLQKAIDAADVLAGPFINFPDAMFSPVSIARLSDGGMLETGGVVRVGDAGPEDIYLPKGAAVSPLTGASGSGPSGGASVHIENLYSGADPTEVARELGWELMKRGI